MHARMEVANSSDRTTFNDIISKASVNVRRNVLAICIAVARKQRRGGSDPTPGIRDPDLIRFL